MQLSICVRPWNSYSSRPLMMRVLFLIMVYLYMVYVYLSDHRSRHLIGLQVGCQHHIIDEGDLVVLVDVEEGIFIGNLEDLSEVGLVGINVTEVLLLEGVIRVIYTHIYT